MDTSCDAAFAFDTQRAAMVEGQLRPNRIIDPAVLAACAAVARETCAGPAAQPQAYADQPLPLGVAGRAGFMPMVAAHLVQAIATQLGGVAGRKVLVLGAGGGYEALLLAHMGATVMAVEEDNALVDRATRNAVASHADAVTVVHAPLAVGYPFAAPYDAILVAVPYAVLPEHVLAQLTEKGFLAGVRPGPAGVLQAIAAHKLGNVLVEEVLMETEGTVHPAFAAAETFVF